MDIDEQPWSILARGAGRWRGREEMPPAPWAPEGMETTATLEARLVLGGRGLASDHVQSETEPGEMRSHTLIRWHGGEEVFLLEFSAGEASKPMVLRGERAGDTIVFEGPGPGGAPMRQRMTWSVDALTVRSEAPDGEGGWMTTFSGAYERAAPSPVVGGIGWHDLTVDAADELREFYARVVGWRTERVEQDGYADWNVLDSEGSAVAGICHRRGPNEMVPPAWLIYVRVETLGPALERVEELGGRVVDGPRVIGPDSRVAVVEDPAGAALALYEIRSGG